MDGDRTTLYSENDGRKTECSKMNDHSQQQKILTVNMCLCQPLYILTVALGIGIPPSDLSQNEPYRL